MSKAVRKVWTFPSESRPDKSYETLQYDDNTTSCNCPGWTRKVAVDGTRSCRHIRLVDQGLADSQCSGVKSYDSSVQAPPAKAATIQTPPAKPVKARPPTGTGKPAVPQRKIRWR
jgi:hypothetical protein